MCPSTNRRRAGTFGFRFKEIGAGYNFTDFSDDLADLSFDHCGVFLNLMGAL